MNQWLMWVARFDRYKTTALHSAVFVEHLVSRVDTNQILLEAEASAPYSRVSRANIFESPNMPDNFLRHSCKSTAYISRAGLVDLFDLAEVPGKDICAPLSCSYINAIFPATLGRSSEGPRFGKTASSQSQPKRCPKVIQVKPDID